MVESHIRHPLACVVAKEDLPRVEFYCPCRDDRPRSSAVWCKLIAGRADTRSAPTGQRNQHQTARERPKNQTTTPSQADYQQKP